MNKVIKALVATVLMALPNLNALDLRVGAGAILPDSVYLETTESLSFEMGTYFNPRQNGLDYGFKTGLTYMTKGTDAGSFVHFDMDILYRLKHRNEVYITGGGVYQKLASTGYGYGYQYGLGYRYVWCKGYMLGAEFSRQELTFKSGSDASIGANGEKYKNHNFLFLVGYRFK